MAKKYSDGSTASKGGDLGRFYTKDELVPNFARAAFDLKKPGDISGVIRSRYGYHIIKLIRRRPKFTESFQDAKGKIMDRMVKKYLAQLTSEYVDKFNPGPDAKINESAISTILKNTTGSKSQSDMTKKQ